MSRKISDYFSVVPKSLVTIKSEEKLRKKAKLDEEEKKCENFTKEIAKSSKVNQNFLDSIKTRECFLILKDIKDQIANQELKLFGEISLNDLKQPEDKNHQNEENKCKFCVKKLSSKAKLLEQAS